MKQFRTRIPKLDSGTGMNKCQPTLFHIVRGPFPVAHLTHATFRAFIDPSMAETSDYQSSISTFIVEDVKIFDGHKFIANGFVYVRDGHIADVGSGKPDRIIGQHTLRISRPQHTLIPGLIDAHIHALAGNTNSVEQSLRFGVTTVCDMHNEVEDIMRLKQVCLSFDWHSG